MRKIDLPSIRLVVTRACNRTDSIPLSEGIPLIEQGFDSLDMMNVYFALEDKYNIQIGDDSIQSSDWATLNGMLQNISLLLESPIGEVSE